MGGLLLGIDLGTSSLKAIVIGEQGDLRAMASETYPLDSPEIGYAEQDPEVWWKACIRAIKQIGRECPLKDINAVGFSGQMHGLVALGKGLKPVRKAILHCDARSTKEVEELNRLFTKKEVQQLMLNPIYTGFLLPSLMWLRKNEPENFKKVEKVCLPKDYLKLKLTGELSSDFSDASATLAFDIEGVSWSKIILDRVGISLDLFPDCYPTTQAVGKVSRIAAEELGLSTHTVVVAGGADQVMQGIGNGVVGPGKATVNIGSSGQVCFPAEQPAVHTQLNCNCFIGHEPGRWIVFGATMTAGLSLSWWNGITDTKDYEAMNREIGKLPAGSGGLIYLPYLNGERTPYIDPNLSGMFAGINITTTRQHMTRAVMEGVAYSLRDCIEVCADMEYQAPLLVASGGGAKSAAWRQIQADIFGVPLVVAKIQEQAGFGAAIAAGAGSGSFKNIEEGCRIAVRYHDEVTEPIDENYKIYQEYYAQYKQLLSSSKDVIHKITLMGRQQ